ncbi:MAG: NAD-dependent epimerase/dehydratase family protein [Lachnospiraceae bacterium]|nr:NAD-dependent epimerase/dehydratase family protein [Lachnospiraceae bacterium]
MKKILITGANSYIGTQFENYIKEWPDEYSVDTVDMIDGSWREKSFAGYDVVFHVAGIAHADVGRASEETKKKYYAVNTDLTIETAKKAKEAGVKQFIFMSSAIVYGESAPMGKEKIITKDTIPEPANFYGDSKLQAEKGLEPLNDDSFKEVILRPPMIYGKGSKGNYPLLAKLAKKMPIFPNVNNQRSMLYVGNLCEFIKIMIDNEETGTFFPQNSEYVSTAQMVKEIANVHGRKIWITKLLNPFVWMASKVPGKVGGLANKAFGSFVYDMEMSEYEWEYRNYNLRESLSRTEK